MIKFLNIYINYFSIYKVKGTLIDSISWLYNFKNNYFYFDCSLNFVVLLFLHYRNIKYNNKMEISIKFFSLKRYEWQKQQF